MAIKPGQLCPSPRLLRISIDSCRCDASFEPLELGLKAFDLLFDIFEFLRPFGSAAHYTHPPNQYLIMIDEFADPAEGGLEGREPIRGFFCNIEEYLRAIRNSLLLR